MDWFTGSVPEAIGQSREKGLIFIVYIEGDNEETQKMNSTWADAKIAETLTKERCIAIKLDHNSEDCNNFSKLYPVVCIPVTYFIGENGLPLEVIGGSLPVEEFVSKANKALEAHQKSRPNTIPLTTPAANSVPQTTGVAANSVQHSSDSTLTQSQPSAQATQDVLTSDIDAIPGTSQEPQNSRTGEMSLQDRVERAKELIEKKRQQEEENEKQDLKRKEFERRHVGQEVTKAKRNREEKQAQDIVNQIKEDRAKERAHRETVRQQIARDKAEREAKRLNELQERQRAQVTSAASSSAVTAGSDRQATRDCTSARLQFRLPDGSSITNSFAVDATLDTIRQFVVNQLGASTSSVTLYTTYPRRELTEEDLVKSLSDLGLAPSSTLVVALRNRSAVAPSGSFSSSDMLLWILSPLFALINFLKAFVFGSPDQPRGTYGRTATRQEPSSQSQESNTTVRRRVPQGGANFRQEGGVYRLTNKDDEDDDNNTWNGNSTQQM